MGYLCFARFPSQVLPESQPLTPISTSTPDHADARTPQSVRSMDSEPLVIPPVANVNPAPVKANQRKRKIDRASINHNSSSRGHTGPASTSEDLPSIGLPMDAPSNNNQSNHSSPCAKRQIIVQNDVMDGTSSHSHGNHTGSVTPASVGHDSGSSPHHSSIEADNSGDSARWRKVSHPSHWDSS
ncbi:unnamed protein product, partial [Allacma fusca]